MEIQNGTPTAQITIAGLQFNVPSPYAEGHTLKANEAGVLNQTLHENFRNNFASRVDKAKEEAKKAEKEIDLSGLQTELDKYVGEYDFGVKRGGAKITDPVEREAREIAKGRISDALKKQGVTLKNVTTEQWNGYIEKALDKYPQLREQAKAVVAARQGATADLDLAI